jgi:hypothetical protein
MLGLELDQIEEFSFVGVSDQTICCLGNKTRRRNTSQNRDKLDRDILSCGKAVRRLRAHPDLGQ